VLYSEDYTAVSMLNLSFIHSHNFFFSVSENLHFQLKFSKCSPCLNMNFIGMHEEEQLQPGWKNMFSVKQKSPSLFLPLSCPFI